MATHRAVVQDIMCYVVHQAVHDNYSSYFNADGSLKDVYDLQLNLDFLSIYCEDPPRPHFPNVNARIKLRFILRIFNAEENSKEFRQFWIGTPCFVTDNQPLRIGTVEDYEGWGLMFSFDFYWNLVLKFVALRKEGKEVTLLDVKKAVKGWGKPVGESSMDVETHPNESGEEEYEEEQNAQPKEETVPPFLA
jgi:hypothetical protein